MTQQDYMAQNALGFEGDTFLKAEIERLVSKHGVQLIIETGTFMGGTTLQFSSMVSDVITFESNQTYVDMVKDKFVGTNIQLYPFDSATHFPIICAYFKNEVRTLLFLDAHWSENNPLLQELAGVAACGMRPVIAIHVWKVPDHSELGFDSYGGQDYEWSWIEESINAIYGKDGYTYHYNSEATGAMRGVVFIEPKIK